MKTNCLTCLARSKGL